MFLEYLKLWKRIKASLRPYCKEFEIYKIGCLGEKKNSNKNPSKFTGLGEIAQWLRAHALKTGHRYNPWQSHMSENLAALLIEIAAV